MLKVGICDDDISSVDQLHNHLVKILFSHCEIEIYHYQDGKEIEKAIRADSFSVDLLFLEIHMKNSDGLKVADFIRKHGVDVDIIFLTNAKNHVYEGYMYKAFAYYLKPVKEELLEQDMLRFLQERKNISENLTINTKSKEIHMPIHKIIYFKSEKRRVTACMLTGENSFYAKMDDIEHLVGGKGFIRCHQSYLVNRSMIDSIGRTEIVAQGITIPMSRKYYENTEVREEESTYVRINRSIALNLERGGAIVFTKGKLLGAILRIQCDKEIRIGRDGIQSDIVVNDSVISRLHCGIRYNSQTDDYTITDYSYNGIYKSNGEKISNDTNVKFRQGEEIWLGNNENVIQLG